MLQTLNLITILALLVSICGAYLQGRKDTKLKELSNILKIKSKYDKIDKEKVDKNTLYKEDKW